MNVCAMLSNNNKASTANCCIMEYIKFIIYVLRTAVIELFMIRDSAD